MIHILANRKKNVELANDLKARMKIPAAVMSLQSNELGREIDFRDDLMVELN